jgi:trigger factor
MITVDNKEKEVKNSLKRTIKIEIVIAEIQPLIDKRLEKISKTMKAPGFRPGKVPLAMVKQAHGVEAESDVINDVINDKYATEIKSSGVIPAGPPEIRPIIGKNQEEKGLDKLFFEAELEVMPDVLVPDVSVLVVKNVVSKVNEEDVDRTIEKLQKQKVNYVEAKRPAKKDDRVSIDFLGRLDGKSFKGGQAKDVKYVLDSGQMVAEFDGLIVGMNAGENKTDKITFPKDYPAEELAGKEVEFDISLNTVEEGKIPEIDEKFVEEFGVKDGTIESFREEVTKNLKREIESRSRSRTHNNALEALLEASDFPIPNVMVQNESARLAERTKATMKEQGMVEGNTDLPANIFQNRAERRVKLGLLVNKVVEEFKLNPNSDQIGEVVLEMSGVYEDPEAFKTWFLQDPKRRSQAEAMALERNVAKWIMKDAKVEDEAIEAVDLLSDATKGGDKGE